MKLNQLHTTRSNEHSFVAIKIGVSGDLGSFSEEAGILYAERMKVQDYSLVYLIDMEGVLSAITRGEIDVGVFPVVNNNSGLVYPAFQAMGRYLFNVVDQVHLDVWQCLLTKQILPLPAIKTIYSYTPAFEQCKRFLAEEVNGVPTIDWGDTAKAARDLSTGVIPDDCAVIGSKSAATAYNLHVLAQNIQDVKPNVTMFVVVTKIN
jgi:prephenate dehydratase